MTTASKIFEELVTELEGLYSQEEAINIMRMVFQEKLGLSRVDMAMDNAREMDEKNRAMIFQIAEKLLEGQPVQQLLGTVHFLNCRLRINKNVLIPRPETEELVHWILNENKEREELHVLDVGTGSGCIAVSLAKNLKDAYVAALDISQPALELARINAISNAVSVDFQHCDVLNEDAWKRLETFDMIVSNPPYVLESEKENMHINVLNHEPHLALFVPDNSPIIFYQKIADLALRRLNKGGRLYFEINKDYGPETKRMLNKKGFKEISLRKDISGRDRFIRAVLP